MSFEIIISAICKSRDFTPSKWKEIFKITGPLRVVRQTICWDFHESYFFLCKTERLCEELLLIHEPFFKMFTISTWFTKIFNLDLFKLPCSKYCIFWGDLIAKCFTTLCYSEWNFFASGSSNVCKVYKYSLRRLWTKIDKRR